MANLDKRIVDLIYGSPNLEDEIDDYINELREKKNRPKPKSWGARLVEWIRRMQLRFTAKFQPSIAVKNQLL